jgi:hypothetical protein
MNLLRDKDEWAGFSWISVAILENFIDFEQDEVEKYGSKLQIQLPEPEKFDSKKTNFIVRGDH